jgi:hypothetical protein
METLPVVFRMLREEVDGRRGEWLLALFPTLPGDDSPQTCASYAHVGQHGVADRALLRAGRPATAVERAPLLAELRGIYESDGETRLRVLQRVGKSHAHEAHVLRLQSVGFRRWSAQCSCGQWARDVISDRFTAAGMHRHHVATAERAERRS